MRKWAILHSSSKDSQTNKVEAGILYRLTVVLDNRKEPWYTVPKHRKGIMSKTKSNAFTDSDFVVKEQEPSFWEQLADAAKNAPVTAFAIQNVEIPRRSTSRVSLQYPIGTLEAGSTQSFFVPAALDKLKNVTARIRQFAYRNDFKVILRQETSTDGLKTGIRVWRKK